MSKETPKDDPRQESDWGSMKQTDKPWAEKPEKDQRSDAAGALEQWGESKTRWRARPPARNLGKADRLNHRDFPCGCPSPQPSPGKNGERERSAAVAKAR